MCDKLQNNMAKNRISRQITRDASLQPAKQYTDSSTYSIWGCSPGTMVDGFPARIFTAYITTVSK